MGMHRDGNRWNLPHDVAEERRKVFWECNAADTFQAHCFSRPYVCSILVCLLTILRHARSSINPEHCDTAFPSEPLRLNGEKSYSILRFELSQLSSESVASVLKIYQVIGLFVFRILNMAMKVRKPAYSDVTELDVRLYVTPLSPCSQCARLIACSSKFEHDIPFSLRCRAALLATPSRYTQLEEAIAASPEPSRRSLAISFQVCRLSSPARDLDANTAEIANESRAQCFGNHHQSA